MKVKLLLAIIFLLGASLRFHNLMRDYPYFFNPDERNMAIAITQFNLPYTIKGLSQCVKIDNTLPSACRLNPHFFAYGQFPLYLAYFSYYIYTLLKLLPLGIDFSLYQSSAPFSMAIFWLRIFSAATSTVSICIVFSIVKLALKNNRIALLTGLFTAFTPQLIQSAHFGTTESMLAFLYLLIVYISLLYLNKRYTLKKFVLISAVITGLSLATKVSSLIFILIPFITLFLVNKKNVQTVVYSIIVLTGITSLVFFIFSPFNLIDFNSFQSSMSYESSVATGNSLVFYTRQFENAKPILFQFTRILPYSLGMPLLVIGASGLVFIGIEIAHSLRRKKLSITTMSLVIIVCAFLLYFIPTSFLYAKWTRFITPVMTFFPIFASVLIFVLLKTKGKIIRFASFIISICIIIPGVAFSSLYFQPDSRIKASQFIYTQIPSGSYILSETANVVDIPLGGSEHLIRPNNYSLTVISFNFYELDADLKLFHELINHLENADYIFVPSRRIFKNLDGRCLSYPKTTAYYTSLFSGALGFEEMKTIKSFPQLSVGDKQFVFDDEDSEETFSVFDHPVIRIFRKTKNLPQEEYERLITANCI